MVTCKEYRNNAEQRIITKEMLSVCLYSVNKRAKNMRDKQRAYADVRKHNRYFFDKYGYEDAYRKKKQEYYALKECLLSIVEPDCIHIEQQNHRQRVFSYERDFHNYSKADIVYRNSYYDYERDCVVSFIDTVTKADKYYLFYDLGKYSFHVPIESVKVAEYKHLPKKEIDNLKTFGHDINDLISMQFVNKVVSLIQSGNYTYIA